MMVFTFSLIHPVSGSMWCDACIKGKPSFSLNVTVVPLFIKNWFLFMLLILTWCVYVLNSCSCVNFLVSGNHWFLHTKKYQHVKKKANGLLFSNCYILVSSNLAGRLQHHYLQKILVPIILYKLSRVFWGIKIRNNFVSKPSFPIGPYRRHSKIWIVVG